MKITLLNHEKIGEYYHVLKFTKPSNYNFIAGQFAKFTLEKELEGDKNYRVFSIASTPKEDFILIATKALPDKTSLYKQNLFSLKEGESIDISEAMGHFTLRDEKSPVVLYASGIGVTPIRSIVKDCMDTAKQDITVVYASYDNYVFEDLFVDAQKNHNNIKFIKTVEVDETMKALSDLAKKYKNEGYYYTSGSPFVVKCVNEAYEKLDIKSDRMIADVFTGY